jgi:hypothetical protein
VRLQVASQGPFVFNVDATKISMANNTIDVTLAYGGALDPVPPPRTNEFFLGQFPAGTYEVKVSVDNGISAQPVGTTSFTVSAKTGNAGTPGPYANFSDLWWNAQQSGWGLNVVQHPSGNLFLTWFAYASDGRPVWYVVPGGTWTQANTFAGALYRVTGPVIGDSFDPAAVTRTLAGTALLQFNDLASPDFGTLSLQVDGRPWASAITRQPF